MLRPYDAELMKAYAVSQLRQQRKNDVEECVEPIEESGVPLGQASLAIPN